MGKNKNFIGSKKIHLHKLKVEIKDEANLSAKSWEAKEDKSTHTDEIGETGRLYIRNLAYTCKEEDIEKLFTKYGPTTEVHLPIDKVTKRIKGFAFVTFMLPEHAVKAYAELDGTTFQGRMLHIIPGKEKKSDDPENLDGLSFKKKKEAKQKALAGSSYNWNSLFLGANAVADVMAEKYEASKASILDADVNASLGVRLALGETQIVAETRDFLLEQGVSLDAFSQASSERSKTVILVKNLPASTKPAELRKVFSKHGTLGRVVLPVSGVTAIIEFMEPTEARSAFQNLAYTKFMHLPLYLEWAPMDVFVKPNVPQDIQPSQKGADTTKEESVADTPKDESSESEEEAPPDTTLFVKNINFSTETDSLKETFSKCGQLKDVVIATKKDMKNPGKRLSMGYGFVEYKKRESAQKALKRLQHAMVDGHALELKLSNKATARKAPNIKKKQDPSKKQVSTKILVRNLPFEAKPHEVKELFSVFGELKTVRLPKKMTGTGKHRGFAFVDFLTKQDAKRAFNALCHSTHLYGRRLVLEWADTEESVDQIRKRTAQQFNQMGPSKKFKKAAILDQLKGVTG